MFRPLQSSRMAQWLARSVSLWCVLELYIWELFHLCTQYVPSYVKTVNVWGQRSWGQVWALRLTLGWETMRCLEKTCDERG